MRQTVCQEAGHGVSHRSRHFHDQMWRQEIHQSLWNHHSQCQWQRVSQCMGQRVGQCDCKNPLHVVIQYIKQWWHHIIRPIRRGLFGNAITKWVHQSIVRRLLHCRNQFLATTLWWILAFGRLLLVTFRGDRGPLNSQATGETQKSVCLLAPTAAVYSSVAPVSKVCYFLQVSSVVAQIQLSCLSLEQQVRFETEIGGEELGHAFVQISKVVIILCVIAI